MQDPKDRSACKRPIKLAETAHDTTGAVAGAVVGVALGGPAGAILGAAAGPVSAVMVRPAGKAITNRVKRMWTVIESAAEIAGTDPDTLEELIAADERHLELAVQALESAAMCTFSERLNAFAVIVAEAATTQDELRFERIGIVARALQHLDRIHVRILTMLPETDQTGWSPERIESATGIPAPELRAVVRQLELQGLIVDERRFNPDGRFASWKISEIGALCIKLIEGRSRN